MLNDDPTTEFIYGLAKTLFGSEKMPQENNIVDSSMEYLSNFYLSKIYTLETFGDEIVGDYHSIRKKNSNRVTNLSDGVVIAAYSQLDFLYSLNKLSDVLSDDIHFQILSPNAFSDLEHMDVLSSFLSTTPVILDLHHPNDLFEKTAYSLVIHNNIAYIGDISVEKATFVHKQQLCDIAQQAITELFGNNCNNMKPLTAEQLVNEMFCGNDTLSIAKKKTRRVSNINRCFVLRPKNNPKITKTSESLERFCDVTRIWKEELTHLGYATFFEISGRTRLSEELTPGIIFSMISSFKEISGVESSVAALFSGVPLEDIIN